MKQKTKKILVNTVLVLFLVLVIMVSAIATIIIVGKHKIDNKEVYYYPTLTTTETISAKEEEKERWQEGWVKYKGNIYQYNDNIKTFLFMGIDKNGKVKKVKDGTNGGQADALFLLVINPSEKDFKIIAINRNTMADVDIYDAEGNYVDTTKAQIAVQHGFGDGVEKSCEYQVNAVSRMMYNIPIHGYAAINMQAIPIINDVLGGVEVEALSDVFDDSSKRIIKKGDIVKLKGELAYWYVRDRDTREFGSADERLARQKQYVLEITKRIREGVAQDATIILDLYNSLMPYMTTNISFEEAAYLLPTVADYSIRTDSIYSLKGDTTQGDKFEEFYLNEDELYNLIIDIFYEEVSID